MARTADERFLAEKFLGLLLKHQERKPRGWVAQLARDTGIALTTLSHVVKGRRLATVRQMLQIADALKAPEILPEGISLPTPPPSARVSDQLPERSDLPASVADQPVPPDMVEWLHEREADDAVRVWELIDIMSMQEYPAEPGDPRGAEYYEGMLRTVRVIGSRSRAR